MLLGFLSREFFYFFKTVCKDLPPQVNIEGTREISEVRTRVSLTQRKILLFVLASWPRASAGDVPEWENTWDPEFLRKDSGGKENTH